MPFRGLICSTKATRMARKHILSDPTSSNKPAETQIQSVVGQGPAAGNRKKNVENRFPNLVLDVCVLLWAPDLG